MQRNYDAVSAALRFAKEVTRVYLSLLKHFLRDDSLATARVFANTKSKTEGNSTSEQLLGDHKISCGKTSSVSSGFAINGNLT